MAPRPPLVFWACLWGLGAVIGIVSLGVDLLTSHAGRTVGRDFTNLWVAGRLVIDGKALCPFNVDCFRAAMLRFLRLVSHQNYSYPPHALFIAIPFALLPYSIALILWTILGVLFFSWAAKPCLPSGFPSILAAFTPAAILNIWNGHYGFLVGGLWLLCFRWLRDRPVRSGAVAGLLTFKPHLGLFIALAVSTRLRAFVAAAITTLTLVLLSAIAFSPESWTRFLQSTITIQTDVLTRTTGDFYFRMMPSAYVVYGQAPVGSVLQAVVTLVVIVMLMIRPRIDAFVAATATFLIIPYVFNYDMTVACLGYAVLLYSRWDVLSLVEKAALSLAFISPELTYFAGWLIPPVLLFALHLQLNFARDDLERHTLSWRPQRIGHY